MTHSEALLREAIRSILLEKKKPGGGITKLGAMKIINPQSASKKIRSALRSKSGDVPAAADRLDISSRTLYMHIDNTPSLEKLKNSLQDDAGVKDDKADQENYEDEK